MFKEVDVVDICAPGYVHESAAVEAFGAGKHVIVEKPFTGYYGPGTKDFRGNQFSKETMLKEAMASSRRILDAAARSGKKLMYAEDWVYAPVIQREREILVASKGQILWMMGEESHSGSHSPSYGIWVQAGGGSIVGKGCHPLTAAMYLKQEEGLASQGKPIRPRTISARVHEVTRNPQYRDLKYLRTDYEDVEDYSQLHLVFEDGMMADIFSTEIVMGGVHNWLEVMANNHRTRCNINPIDAITTYNPKEEQLKDVYIVEKIGTKQGWSHPAPDEDWMDGYPQELQDFMECVYHNREPKCGATLAHDTVGVMYSAYLSAERHGAEVEIPR
jgi:predicted dehydrogenase